MSSFGQGNVNVNISGNAQGLITAMNQGQQAVTKTTTAIQQGTDKAGKSTQGLAEKFSGNRGLIYSLGTIFGTITGVVAEFALLEEANNSVAEATDKLRVMEERGEQGTQKYTQTQQELDKALRFQRFTWRNLALAVTNFIPEILLLATGLSKAKVAADTASKSTQALATAEKATATATVASNAAQKASNATMLASGKPVQDLRVAYAGLTTAEVASGEAAVAAGTATRRALIRTGIGALLVAAGTALLAFIENWGKFRDKVNEAGVALGKFMPILKPILDIMSQIGHWLGQVLGNEAKTGTDEASKGFKGLSKEAVQAAKDVTDAWHDTLDELVKMSKKERLKFLKELGFGKEGAKKIQIGVEIVEDKEELFKQLEKALSFANQFHLDPKNTEKLANNLVEDIRDKIKDAGGKLDFMQGLIDVIQKNKGKGPEILRNAVAGWFTKLPADIKTQLAMESDELTPEKILTGLGVNPETFGATVQSTLKKSLTGSVDLGTINLFKSGAAGIMGVGDIGLLTGGKGMGGSGGGGFVNQFINAIKTGFTKESLAGVGTAFTSAFVSAISWTGAQVAPVIVGFGQALIPLFGPGSMKSLGDQFTISFVKAVVWAEPTIKSIVIGFGQSLIKLFQPKTWESLSNQFQISFIKAMRWTEDIVKPIIIGLGQQLIKLFDPKSLASLGDQFVKSFTESIKWKTDMIKTVIIGLGQQLIKLLDPKSLASLGEQFMSAFTESIKWKVDMIKKIVIDLGQQLIKLFDVKSLASLGEQFMTAFMGAAKATQEALGTFIVNLTNDLKSVFNVAGLTDIATSFWDGLMDAIGKLPDLAGKLVVILNTAFKSAINALFQAFTGSDETILQSFTPGKKKAPTTVGVDEGGVPTDTRSESTKNLDVMNRQFLTIAQTIKVVVAAYNVLAKATLVVNADILKLIGSNNVYAKTLVVVAADSNALVKSNNVLAKTLVTVSQDVGAGVKQNNVYAKTIVTVTKDVSAWTKANNTLARTITTVSKDVDAAVKKMNTFARALVTVGKDAASAAKDVKTLASAINSLKDKTVTVTTKKVTVGAHMSSTNLDSNLNTHASSNGMLNVTIVNEDEFGQKKLKRFRSQLGKESFRFG